MADAKKDKLQIRNSTVDFLVFTKDAHEDGIEVRVQDHDVWLTQKAIARLFDVDRSVVTKHLKNVYERLDNDVFMYTHQGYIANFNYIKEVKKDVVCFGRGMEVPLSRKYHDQIKELHLDKIRRAYKEQELNYN